MWDRLEIFEYQIGDRKRFADPIQVWTDFQVKSNGEIVNWMNEVRTTDGKAINSMMQIIEVARNVFGLPEINSETGEGFTIAQVNKVFLSFIEFIDEKKNPHESCTTSSASTADSTPGSTHMPSQSVCGSTLSDIGLA